MKIAVVTTSYPAHEGDPSGHFVAAEVEELRRDGHAVSVVRPSPGGAFGWPGVAARVRERPTRALMAGWWCARAGLELRRGSFDRVVAHWSLPCAFPITAMSSTVVELDVVSHGGDVRLLACLPGPLRAHIVRTIAGRARLWRFVSRRLLDGLAETLGDDDADALRRKAVVAPSPLTMYDIRAEARAHRDALGARRLYVCAGRLVQSKRMDKVIDYVASARGQKPVLVVLGDGPERTRLETLARRWRLDARFLGTTPRREALSWIGAADEFVHASRVEGLSTVVREAEHLGVTVTLLA